MMVSIEEVWLRTGKNTVPSQTRHGVTNRRIGLNGLASRTNAMPIVQKRKDDPDRSRRQRKGALKRRHRIVRPSNTKTQDESMPTHDSERWARAATHKRASERERKTMRILEDQPLTAEAIAELRGRSLVEHEFLGTVVGGKR